MTELFINGQLIQDIDAEIGMTFSSFKLDSLGTRKGSFSNVFELPKTNQTKLIFENCELVTSLTNIPYQINPCQIFVDGQLIVDGSAVIRETKENYNIFISAGNSDFFKSIGSLKIKDVDLSEFDHDYNLTEIRIRRESREGFVYPNIDYGFFEFQDFTAWNTAIPVIPNRRQYFNPSIWVKTIVEKACIQLGYTINGDLIDSLVFQNSVVLCKGSVVKETDSLAKYRHNIDFGLLSGSTQKISFPPSGRIEDKSNLYQFNNIAGINQSVYSPNIALNSDVNFVINFAGKVVTKNPRDQTNGEVNIDLLIYNDLGTLLFTLPSEIIKFENRFFGLFNIYKAPSSGVLERDFILTLRSPAVSTFLNTVADLTTLRLGWNVRVDRGNLGDLKFENIEFEINQISKQTGRRVSPVIKVEAENVLPQNETIGDLLLTLSNIEGIIFQVDETTKEVKTNRIDRLIENKGNALNWSNKIDLTEDPEVFYNIDNFSQSNIYKFAEDDKDTFLISGSRDGSIEIQNNNLPTERIVFESKFAPVPVASTFFGELVMGRVFTGDKYSFDGFNFNLIDSDKIEEFTPRLAVLSESPSILNTSPNNPSLINFNVNPLGLDFERAINDNYNLIKSVLVNTKLVKALFLLDLDDIVNLDFTRPVFVDYFGEYFYIESINQFKVNKRESCFVTLVRI